MSIIYVLIPISLLFAVLAVCFFFWGVRGGQFDDLESPAKEIIFQDESLKKEEIKKDTK